MNWQKQPPAALPFARAHTTAAASAKSRRSRRHAACPRTTCARVALLVSLLSGIFVFRSLAAIFSASSGSREPSRDMFASGVQSGEKDAHATLDLQGDVSQSAGSRSEAGSAATQTIVVATRFFGKVHCCRRLPAYIVVSARVHIE